MARRHAERCRYYKHDGTKCSKLARKGSDWCGQCAHKEAPEVSGETLAQARRSVLHAARRMATRDADYDRVQTTIPNPNLVGTATPELIDGARSKLADALVARAKVTQAKGPAAVAARDQADAALNDYAAYEDAIRQRHPDPYGAAITTSMREDVMGQVSNKAHVRRWLADNPDADVDTIHRALNDIAEGDQERAELEAAGLLAPGQPVQGSDVDGLNRLAATRARFLADRTPLTEEAFRRVESWWRRTHPSKQPVTA